MLLPLYGWPIRTCGQVGVCFLDRNRRLRLLGHRIHFLSGGRSSSSQVGCEDQAFGGLDADVEYDFVIALCDPDRLTVAV